MLTRRGLFPLLAGAALPALHHDTASACAEVGIAPEAKPFQPHLTLARIQSPEGLPAVRQAIAQRATLDFGRYTAHSFGLYESRPGPGGSEYLKLEEFPLL